MARSSLFGRRIHITGSIAGDTTAATPEEVCRAREVAQVASPCTTSTGVDYWFLIRKHRVRPSTFLIASNGSSSGLAHA